LERNAYLELMNEMRHDKFGASSERSRQLLDQLELTFEELEANASETELLGQIAATMTTAVTDFPHPDHAPRLPGGPAPRRGRDPSAGGVPLLRLRRSESSA